MRPYIPKYTIEDMHQLADLRGGRCLSKEYWDFHTKLTWQCKIGHSWDALPSIIIQGGWCPQCPKQKFSKLLINKKLIFIELKKIAISRGGKCLSDKYINSNTKLKWQCKKGHIWEAVPSGVKSGRWCPVCARKFVGKKNRATNIEEIKKLAESKGGKCLSKEFVNQYIKLEWQCKHGHTWKASNKMVKKGYWCYQCKTMLKFEKIKEIAKNKGGKCLSKKYINNHTNLQWQCKRGHKWKATPASILKGLWCFKCYRIERASFSLKKMKEIAKKRGGKCLSDKYIDKETKLEWQCKKGHIWKAIPNAVKRGSWCPYCAKRIKHTIEDMQKLAEKNSGKCLSDKFFDVSTKLKWQCNNGHIWETTPTSIKNGRWCPYCVKLTIEDMQELAARKNGKCLSAKFINTTSKLIWQCKEGHTWEAVPYSIKRGSWCPYCAKLAKLTIEEMKKIAESRDGKCLSDKYINCFNKLIWQCKEGHIWKAAPNDIKKGTWCPICARKKKNIISST